MNTGASAQQFDPFNAYAQDLYSSNHNAAWSKYNAGKNRNMAGIMGGIGLIAAPFTGGASLALTGAAAAGAYGSK